MDLGLRLDWAISRLVSTLIPTSNGPRHRGLWALVLRLAAYQYRLSDAEAELMYTKMSIVVPHPSRGLARDTA